MSEYEPGTVAVATVRGVPNVRVFRTDDRARPWISSECLHLRDTEVTDVRPLVVLDLEAAPDPDNLLMLLRGVQAETTSVTVGWLADQIEAQTKPPLPAEPTDPAVRVIDKDGAVWASHDGEWCCLTTSLIGRSWTQLVRNFGPLEVRP